MYAYHILLSNGRAVHLKAGLTSPRVRRSDRIHTRRASRAVAELKGSTLMKKFSRYGVITLIFSAAGFLAVTIVPTSASGATPTTTVQVVDSSEATTSASHHSNSRRVWEW